MDSHLNRLLKAEVKRQQETLDLIPSENVAVPEMLAILASPLSNKYSEGYPGRRYYPGNAFVDEIEELARERVLAAFKLSPDEWAVNVQPYSGSPANQAIYLALANVGDTVMGLSLASGGHLTHGHKVNFSGIQYHSVPYGLVEKTARIDYDALERKAKEVKPVLIFSGATAYPRAIDFARIGKIAKAVGAYHIADISHIAGLVAAGVHPAPFPHADVVMMTTQKTLRGPRGAVIVSRKRQAILRQGSGQASDKRKDGKLINELIDRAVFPGLQGGPHDATTAAIAWTFGQVATPAFKRYGAQIVKNARALAQTLARAGDTLVSGGTDNHLMLLDVRPFGLTGAEAETMLEKSGIIANRNSIPGDEKPLKPSGVRMGTPALTSRGMKEREMTQLAGLIHACLAQRADMSKQVRELCKKFPLPYSE